MPREGRASARPRCPWKRQPPSAGRAARPIAAVVPLGKHAMPREGRASARPMCPWKRPPPSGRAARPIAAVVPLGKHAMPREGRASARPRCPWKRPPPSGSAARPFAAVVPGGRLEILEGLEGLAGLNSRGLEGLDEPGETCHHQGARRKTCQCDGRAERLLGQCARGNVRHRLVGRRDPSPPWCPWKRPPPSGRAASPFAAVVPWGEMCHAEGGPSVCSAKVPVETSATVW